MMTEMSLHGDKLFDSLPIEMVVHTLSFIDADTLSNCRLVCKKWQTLIDTNVFQEKAYRENHFVNNGQGYYSFSQISSNDVRRLDLPWYLFYVICKYDPFNRNLVKNHCGQDGLTHWESMKGSLRNPNGCLWEIEQIPQRELLKIDDSNFDGHTTCFSSHEKHYLTKSQKIIFKNYGLNNTIIETLKPKVEVSTWFKGLNTLDTKYSFIVNICYPNKNCLQSHFLHENSFPDGKYEWKKMSCLFPIEEYVSYINISHFLQDTSPFVQNVSESFNVTCSVLKMLLPLRFKSAE